VKIGAVPQQAPTSDCRIIINNLIPSITIMLGPFGFLFCILNCIMKIIDCVKAVPSCITQLSPSPLTSALSGLAQAVVCLAQLIPQFSMLYLIDDILKMLIAFLTCLISALSSLDAIGRDLAAAITTAGNDDSLKAQLSRAVTQTSVMTDQTLSVTNPLTALFSVINLFLPLFGQSAIVFSVPAPGSPIAPVIADLTVLQTTLQNIKSALDAIIG
jgi:hypothetical protein